MDTGVLYYKKFERKVVATDYIEWAFCMLHNGMSSPSLNILVALTGPLNIFELEEYFDRALNELDMAEPSYEESVKDYVEYLLKQIVNDQSKAVGHASEIYVVVCEHFIGEEQARWYEISEMIDDFFYGDNRGNITRDSLNKVIVQASKKQLKNKNV